MNKSAYLTVENPMAATFRYLAISIMFMFVGFLFGKLFIPASLVYIANIFVVVLVVGLLIFSLMSRKNVIPRSFSMNFVYLFTFVDSFYGCGLEFVSIPKTVSHIGKGAFGDCTKLKHIKLNNSTPPTIGSVCFYDESEKTILIEQILVPKNSVETYKSTKGWTEYSDKIIGY